VLEPHVRARLEVSRGDEACHFRVRYSIAARKDLDDALLVRLNIGQERRELG
jgi:hypothetical protein